MVDNKLSRRVIHTDLFARMSSFACLFVYLDVALSEALSVR